MLQVVGTILNLTARVVAQSYNTYMLQVVGTILNLTARVAAQSYNTLDSCFDNH